MISVCNVMVNMDYKEAQKHDPLIMSYVQDPGKVSECRESSVDSGFFHSTPPFSDTDSEIVETLNRYSLDYDILGKTQFM